MNFTSKAIGPGPTPRPQTFSAGNSPEREDRKGSTPASYLQIRIDRITLHGYAPADQGRFTRMLSRELTKLAHAHEAIDWSAVARAWIGRLDAGQLRAGASAEEAARRIAQQIFANLTQRRGKNRGSDNA
jgi:hypothetical protein